MCGVGGGEGGADPVLQVAQVAFDEGELVHDRGRWVERE
jgi:hypothetical protein